MGGEINVPRSNLRMSFFEAIFSQEITGAIVQLVITTLGEDGLASQAVVGAKTKAVVDRLVTRLYLLSLSPVTMNHHTFICM